MYNYFESQRALVLIIFFSVLYKILRVQILLEKEGYVSHVLSSKYSLNLISRVNLLNSNNVLICMYISHFSVRFQLFKFQKT